MKLEDFVRNLSQASTKYNVVVPAALYEGMEFLREELKDNSPEDSGYFNSNWKISLTTGLRGAYQSSVYNDTSYGDALWQGATLDDNPWLFSRQKHQKTWPESKSGKLIYSGGRIWAGGKSASGFVEGGIGDRVVTDANIHKVAELIADAVVGTI